MSHRTIKEESSNERLKQLALKAQQQPSKSQQRQRALAQLISAIQLSGMLARPYRGYFRGFYEEIYAEAQQRLFFHICEKIDSYDPQYEVLQWANFLLTRRFFIDASRTIMPTSPSGTNHKQIKRLSIDDLDRNSPPEVGTQEIPSLLQEVIQCLEEDPEGIFQSTHIINNPAANFQFIAIQRAFGYSWKEISTELGIGIPTLSSFYQRCLTTFAHKLREYMS